MYLARFPRTKETHEHNVRATSFARAIPLSRFLDQGEASSFPLWSLRLSLLADRVITNEIVSGIFDRLSVSRTMLLRHAVRKNVRSTDAKRNRGLSLDIMNSKIDAGRPARGLIITA